jgi:signal transduction histidine kinase
VDIFGNTGWFFVGVTITAIGVLGFVIFYNNRESETHRSFLLFSMVTMFWSFFNYLNSQIVAPEIVLWSIRVTIFLAVWHAFTFFRLCYVFPKEKYAFPQWYKWLLLPSVCVTSLLALTPLVFRISDQIMVSGQVPLVRGPAIFLFILLLLFLIPTGLFSLFKKMQASPQEAKKQFRYILGGSAATFILLILFNFVLPSFYNNTSFIPFGALFMLPFILSTAYTITKHHLLNIKIIKTEFFVFTLVMITLFQIILANGILNVIMGFSVFVLVLIFGISLIRNARTELEQRQKIEQIAKDLAIANEHLRELDKEKSEFVSIASHQLRTPLTAISGYASMLLEGSYGKLSKKIEEAINRISQSSGRLVLIIEDFLDITKIEQGRMTYQFVTVEMRGLLRGVVEELEPRAREKNIELVLVTEDSGSFNATADFGKIRQVMSNLIDNAVKYSGAGKIEITLTRDTARGKLLASVHDTGIGISPQTMEKLFQKFSRAEGVKKIYTEGSGLGLYVAQEMVKAHHGRIWAESEGEGKGSTFRVELMGED